MPRRKARGDDVMMTAQEVATRLGVSLDTVYRHIADGEFAGAIDISTGEQRATWRIPSAAVGAFEIRRAAR